MTHDAPATLLPPAAVPEIDMPYDCDVYEPAEDTFLFLDALQDELPFLAALDPTICLEIGSGSGAVFVYLANALAQQRAQLTSSASTAANTHAMFFATDINPLAASVARNTATINSVQAFDVVRTDLVACVEQRLRHQIDVLLFNPPYVPTPSDEVGSTGIEAAWAGGVDGREVIDRVLPKLKDLLSPIGVLYMVVVVENKPLDIEAQLARDGFHMTVVRSTKAQNERLSILKFTRAAGDVL